MASLGSQQALMGDCETQQPHKALRNTKHLQSTASVVQKQFRWEKQEKWTHRSRDNVRPVTLVLPAVSWPLHVQFSAPEETSSAQVVT